MIALVSAPSVELWNRKFFLPTAYGRAPFSANYPIIRIIRRTVNSRLLHRKEKLGDD